MWRSQKLAVRPEDAANSLKAKNASSECELMNVWASMGIVDSDADGAPILNVGVAIRYYDSACMVSCADVRNGRAKRSCKIAVDESICPHTIAVYDKHAPDRYNYVANLPTVNTALGGRPGNPVRSQKPTAKVKAKAEAKRRAAPKSSAPTSGLRSEGAPSAERVATDLAAAGRCRIAAVAAWRIPQQDASV